MYKKVISIVIAIVLCISTSCIAIAAENNTQDTSTINNSSIFRYYPFVHDISDEFLWRNDIIGPNNCIAGYLYVKDLQSGSITQLLDIPVSTFAENETELFCLTNNDTTILRVNYAGTTIDPIYISTTGSISNLNLRGDYLFFTEENSIYRYNILTNDLAHFGSIDDVIFVYPTSEDTIIIQTSSNEEFLYNLETQRATEFSLTEESFSELTCFEAIASPSFVYAPLADTEPLQETFPFANYPSGSYFSDNGSACTCHNDIPNDGSNNECSYLTECNCKVYGSSIQCMAFARYAYDRYSHRSSWTVISGDTDNTLRRLASNSDVLAIYSSVPYGSYFRVGKVSGDGGTHSIVLKTVNSSVINTYECNVDGKCGVTERSFSLSDWRTKYPYVTQIVSHNYSKHTVESATHHKSVCSSVGCKGYIYQPHYSLSPGTTATCAACGYVGNIMNGPLAVTPPTDAVIE